MANVGGPGDTELFSQVLRVRESSLACMRGLTAWPACSPPFFVASPLLLPPAGCPSHLCLCSIPSQLQAQTKNFFVDLSECLLEPFLHIVLETHTLPTILVSQRKMSEVGHTSWWLGLPIFSAGLAWAWLALRWTKVHTMNFLGLSSPFLIHHVQGGTWK